MGILGGWGEGEGQACGGVELAELAASSNPSGTTVLGVHTRHAEKPGLEDSPTAPSVGWGEGCLTQGCVFPWRGRKAGEGGCVASTVRGAKKNLSESKYPKGFQVQHVT